MSSLAVLVLSCDRYQPLWDVFFGRMGRFWPDCPYPVYLLANHARYVGPGATTLAVGEDRDWSSNLLTALDSVQEPRVLVTMDDAVLNAPVDTARFRGWEEVARQLDVDYLNMKASPRPPRGTSGMGVLPSGTHYRAAVALSIWKVEALRALLLPGETAWQFEIRGSRRSDVMPKFYALSRPFFSIVHCIIKGRLDPRAARALSPTELAGLDGFPEMGSIEYSMLRIREARSAVLNLLPASVRRSARDWYFGSVVGRADWV